MKEEIYLKFWTKVGKETTKFITLRVVPMSDENPHLFIHCGAWSMFIERCYVVDDESSPDWREYFKIDVLGCIRLHVYSDKYQINFALSGFEK